MKKKIDIELGFAFLTFWTPFFMFIERVGFHMSWDQIGVARAIAGVFNFGIGLYYFQIKRKLGGAKGMLAIKVAVTFLAYSTVIITGLAEFHVEKLIIKTCIASTAGYYAGKWGWFDFFYNRIFDYYWKKVFARRGRRRKQILVQIQEEKVEQDWKPKKQPEFGGTICTQYSSFHAILTIT